MKFIKYNSCMDYMFRRATIYKDSILSIYFLTPLITPSDLSILAWKQFQECTLAPGPIVPNFSNEVTMVFMSLIWREFCILWYPMLRSSMVEYGSPYCFCMWYHIRLLDPNWRVLYVWCCFWPISGQEKNIS